MDLGNQDLEKMAAIMEKMKGKSDDELIREIAHMIKSGQGGLTPAKVKKMIETIKPMLDSRQREKLQRLANML